MRAHGSHRCEVGPTGPQLPIFTPTCTISVPVASVS